MRLAKSWVISRKDFKAFRRKKNVLYTLLIFPIAISILLSAVLTVKQIPAAQLSSLLPAFAFFYVILAGVVPTAIASYTIVGEKVEKTLEPLLAAPVTDGEILLGKGISAFLPSILAIFGGSILFMVLADLATQNTFGYYYFPNVNTALTIFLMVPLATLMSVEWNVVVSGRVTDVRIAQQLGGLIVLPFALIYVLGEINVIPLNVTNNLLIISGILALIDVALFSLARETFQREEILTKWK
ncbi:MAG TPA: ABC transporter permease subunit [Methanomassiliicoccales archaeon]|nr:ABC transporter permease subunit [Methanomassiliicoccales archaeon]